jgi:serine/threonine protein kinase
MLTIDETNKLGCGSFGTVFSGRLDGQPVAVKKIPLPHHSSDSLRCLQTEINIHTQLKHKNIVNLFISKLLDNSLCLVLELMESGDLFDLLYTHDTPLDSLRCVTIAEDIVAGLDYLHNQGFLHRDIKPENILFNHHMQAKIADFGLATETTHSYTSHFIGTKCYAAPELALSVIHDDNYTFNELTDIYALGITLLEMILRDRPYHGKSERKVSWEEIATGDHSDIPRETHPLLAHVISICLVIDPLNRASTHVLNQLFSIFCTEEAVSAPPAVHRHSIFHPPQAQKTTHVTENSIAPSLGSMG